MLETQSVKSLCIVHRSDYSGGPCVFQICADLIPEVHQQMGHSTPLHSAVLVRLAPDFRAQPVQHIALIDLGWQHGAGYVPEIPQRRGVPTLRNHGNEFLLPGGWPDACQSYFIVDAGERDRQERAVSIHERRENVPLHHGLRLLKSLDAAFDLVRLQDWQCPGVGPGDIGGLQRLKFRTDPVEKGRQLCRGLHLRFPWEERHRVKRFWPVLGLEGLDIPEEVPRCILHQQTLLLAFEVSPSPPVYQV